jgi:DNA polymerase III subunit gamma/tau
MSIALARKYRPKRFADVAVQSHVSTTLKGAIERGRVAHGYLLCGPRGTGKTTLARVLAMALNCERRGDASLHGEPCGECDACRRIWSGSASLDVVEIDAASNRGVDDARDLRERAMYAPSTEEGYKVYIVDEAHMLTREAWNALLKILEEPPPRVVFVFATTEPQKIMQSAAPVLSRVQRFDLKRIGSGEIRQRLAHILGEENVKAEPEALAAIARAADGSMRDALSLTDQVLSMAEGTVTAERVRDALGLVREDEFIAILDLIADRRASEVFPTVARLAEAGVDFGSFLMGLADMIRAQLSVVLGGAPAEVSERARAALEERKDRFVAGDLLRMLQTVGELEPRFRKSGQQQLLIETLLVRFALLDKSVELEDVLRSIGDGGGSPAPFVRPEPRPAEASGARTRGLRAESSELRDARQSTASRAQPSGPAVEAVAPRALSPQPSAPSSVPSLNDITGKWDDFVDSLRTEKPMLASALGHSSPLAVASSGAVTIGLDEPNDIFAHSINTAKGEVLAALRQWFPAIERVELKRDDSASGARPIRLTDEMLRAQRIASLAFVTWLIS